jgi:hypothetical protein
MVAVVQLCIAPGSPPWWHPVRRKRLSRRLPHERSLTRAYGPVGLLHAIKALLVQAGYEDEVS